MRRFAVPRLRPVVRRVALVASYALLTTLSQPRYSLHLLGWVALVPLLFLLDDVATPKRAARLGWVAGFASFLGIIGWLYIIGQYTGVGLPWGWVVAGFGAVMLAAYLALYVALFSALVVTLLPRQGVRYVLGVPVLWVFCEWLRSWIITGFPWGGLGYTQWNNALVAQFASLGGVPLISLLVACVNGAIANKLRRLPDRSAVFRDALPAVFGLLFAVIYGIVSLMTQPTAVGSFRVAVVPGNIAQRERWDRPSLSDNLTHYLTLMERAAEHEPDVIVLPETSVLMPYLSESDRERFLAFSRAHHMPVLFGSPLFYRSGETRIGRNAAILLDSNGDTVGEYYKQHLVPYGEYIPFRQYLPKFIADSWIGVADWVPGEESVVLRLNLGDADLRLGVPICFESVFADISRDFVRKGANVLAVLTNDGWYEGTSAIPQHNAFSVFRAKEGRRWVVRAANRGISCFISPSGQMLPDRVLPRDPDGIIVASIPLLEGGTPYAAMGDWASYLAIAATLAMATVAIRKRRALVRPSGNEQGDGLGK